MTSIPNDSAVAIDLVFAVREGKVAIVERLLAEQPELATARLVSPDGGSRTPLHVVTDWPGYFPNGPEITRLLLARGADVDARTAREPGETALHWAASSDDVDVAEVLIDGGADIEAPDGSIGTPLDNAVGYGCWNVARLLVARGARVEKLWHAGALGRLDVLAALLDGSGAARGAGGAGGAGAEEISQAFWHACAAAQRRAAELLLAHGADLNWEPTYAHGTPLDAARGPGTRRENVQTWLARLGARSADAPPELGA